MRNKTACFGWYGRAVSIWFDRPKSKLRQLASGQNPSALHSSCNAETGFKLLDLKPQTSAINPKASTLNPYFHISQNGGGVLREVHRQKVQRRRPERGRKQLRGQVASTL